MKANRHTGGALPSASEAGGASPAATLIFKLFSHAKNPARPKSNPNHIPRQPNLSFLIPNNFVIS
jgi:hypothetical protein